jgi:hypothetical protein
LWPEFFPKYAQYHKITTWLRSHDYNPNPKI